MSATGSDNPREPSARSDRARWLAALAQAIRRGEYRPDASRIAEALLRALPWTRRPGSRPRR